MKERKNNNSLLLLFGMAAGAAAGLYLNSDKGRAMRRRTGEQLNRWGEDWNDRARNGMSQLSSTVSSAVDRSKEYLEDVGDNVRSRLDNIYQKTESMTENNGLHKAKKRIQKRLRQLEEAVEHEMQ